LGLEVINVAGATGYYDTDYKGKAKAALKALEEKDFVFVHVEAPDEAGHNGDLREKITAIERFDQLVVGTILKAFKRKRNFRILVLPDHATPISVKTHTTDVVCFGIFGKDIPGRGFLNYSEKEAGKSDLYFEKGFECFNSAEMSAYDKILNNRKSKKSLKKDKEGKVIGIEKLYVAKNLGIEQPLPVEVVVA
jgi:2,3-bisphosphoglycerate-independent phosphoglycerate mutase